MLGTYYDTELETSTPENVGYLKLEPPDNGPWKEQNHLPTLTQALWAVLR